jgi:phage terminase small subunit
MSRPRQPSAVLEAKGSFLSHPARARSNEPTDARPLGGPPKHLDIEHKKLWRELQKHLMPGVAFYSDRTAFEALVRIVYQLRKGTLSNHGYTLLLQFTARFAMNPADRSRVSVEKDKESKLSKFLNKPKSTANGTTPAVRQQLQ